ncbi:cytochrome c peroxidase [Neoaquamicrobium sediminum]|uniref:cytochrome c peroxidase n=1 Tax=Neoaquamicrobium sediminum TaxID=1849104 RepID=UPI0035E40BEA
MRTADGGGLFHDGRAVMLEEPVGGPPLNPAEMGMPDTAAVAARLRENETYRAAFAETFGPGILDDPEAAFGALTQAVAAFERTDAFAPFDSKYGRFLLGEATRSDEEEVGRVLFLLRAVHELHANAIGSPAAPCTRARPSPTTATIKSACTRTRRCARPTA